MNKRSLFDRQEGIMRTDEAVERVTRGMDATWAANAYQAALKVTRTLRYFTTDDIWEELREIPREPRAMGAILRRLRLDGHAIPTLNYRPTHRPEAHRNPKRVWKSLAIIPKPF